MLWRFHPSGGSMFAQTLLTGSNYGTPFVHSEFTQLSFAAKCSKRKVTTKNNLPVAKKSKQANECGNLAYMYLILFVEKN